VDRVTLKFAAIGAGFALVGYAISCALSESRTLLGNWMFGVQFVCSNVALAVAFRYGAGLFACGLAGTVGMLVGGWVGAHTIGDYEYAVPVPPEDRVITIRANGTERTIELKDIPTEMPKRIAAGRRLGATFGWVAGVAVYAVVSLRRSSNDDSEPNAEDHDSTP
jgi:hypothetical protein